MLNQDLLTFFKSQFLKAGLSKTQLIAALHVMDGLDNKEIAKEMNICLGMVKQHIGEVYKKTGSSGRSKFITDFYKSFIYKKEKEIKIVNLKVPQVLSKGITPL